MFGGRGLTVLGESVWSSSAIVPTPSPASKERYVVSSRLPCTKHRPSEVHFASLRVKAVGVTLPLPAIDYWTPPTLAVGRWPGE